MLTHVLSLQPTCTSPTFQTISHPPVRNHKCDLARPWSPARDPPPQQLLRSAPAAPSRTDPTRARLPVLLRLHLLPALLGLRGRADERWLRPRLSGSLGRPFKAPKAGGVVRVPFPRVALRGHLGGTSARRWRGCMEDFCPRSPGWIRYF